MAIRIREDGRILCAAMHPEHEGDLYVDDALHYHLSCEAMVLVTEAHEKHKEHGQWWWRGQEPSDAETAPFYWEDKP